MPSAGDLDLLLALLYYYIALRTKGWSNVSNICNILLSSVRIQRNWEVIKRVLIKNGVSTTVYMKVHKFTNINICCTHDKLISYDHNNSHYIISAIYSSVSKKYAFHPNGYHDSKVCASCESSFSTTNNGQLRHMVEFIHRLLSNAVIVSFITVLRGYYHVQFQSRQYKLLSANTIPKLTAITRCIYPRICWSSSCEINCFYWPSYTYRLYSIINKESMQAYLQCIVYVN